MFKLFKVCKDIKIYRDYLKIINKEAKDSPIWARKRLRKDYLGRIYTVVNLPPEIIYAVDLPKESRPSFVMNELKSVNEYLKSLNIEEIITISLEPIKDTNDESFLVVYQYVFRELSWTWIFRFVIEIILVILAIINRNYLINLF